MDNSNNETIEQFLKRRFNCPEDEWNEYSFFKIKAQFIKEFMANKEDLSIVKQLIKSYNNNYAEFSLSANPIADISHLYAFQESIAYSTLILGVYMGYMLRLREGRREINMEDLLKPFDFIASSNNEENKDGAMQ